MDKREAEIVRDICVYLDNCGMKGLYSVTNASANTRYHKGRVMAEGWFDIVGCLPGGKFLGVEAKTKQGTLSRCQELLHRNVNDMGGIAIVARGVKDVSDAIYEYALR